MGVCACSWFVRCVLFRIGTVCLLPERFGIDGHDAVLQVQLGHLLHFCLHAERHLGRRVYAYLHRGEPSADETQFPGSRVGRVQNVFLGKRAAVRPLHDNLLVVPQVAPLQQGAERQLQMGACHAVLVVRFSVAHFVAVQGIVVVRRFSLQQELCM